MQFTASILILAAIIIVPIHQFGWEYFGNGLDVGREAYKKEQTYKKPIRSTEYDKIGTLRHTDPPMEKQPSYGELFGFLHIKRWGEAWTKPIFESTDKRILDRLGVNHYSSTALPGQKGNFALAGHAMANDFGYLDQLVAGEHVYVETSDNWYEYTVTKHMIVDESQTEVLNADATGFERGITLQTCYPMLAQTATRRYIVQGWLSGWMPKTDGVPRELAQKHASTAEKLARRMVTVTNSFDYPITGVLALSLLGVWVMLELILWMACWKRMRLRWKLSEPTGNIFALIWRLQAAPVVFNQKRLEQSGKNMQDLPVHNGRVLKTVSVLVRLVTSALLAAAFVFACWRWVCPWMADTWPALFGGPHPSM